MTDTPRNEAYWIQVYKAKRAYWLHDGNPLRPHAELTSGKHSDGFFNSRRVIPDEEKLREAASDLVDRLTIVQIWAINRVVGPQTGARLLAEYIADEIGRRRGRPCAWASPSKHGEGDDRSMVFKDGDGTVEEGEVVLLVEDVVSTGGSVERTALACLRMGATLLPLLLVLVNRSGQSEVADGKVIKALIEQPMPMWDKAVCTLCEVGSKAIPAKDPVNWSALNAEY